MAQGDRIAVRLSAEGQAELVRALREVSKEADDANRKSSKLFRELKSLLPTLGLGAVVTGFTALVRSAADFEDAMGKAAARAGSGVENFSALAFASRTADVGMVELEASLVRVARSVAELRSGAGGQAAEAFRALGLSARDFAGLDTAQSIELLARRLAALPPSIDRTNLATRLLGESGARLLPLLQDVATKGLGQLRAEAEAFNALVRGETAEAAQEFNDNLERVRISASGLARNLVRDLLPGLADVTRAMSEAAKESGVLQALFVGLGGIAALALGRTDAQRQAREIAEAMRKLEEAEQRIARTRQMLEAGRLEQVRLFGIPLTPAAPLSEEGRSSLSANLEKDLALVETLRKRLAELQAQAAKPPAGDGESVLGGDFDARRRLAELEKQIGGEQLRTLEDLAKRRDALAQLELQQQQRIAEARASTTQQTAQVELEALRRREALARQAHDTEVRLAQTREQALADLAARTTGSGRERAALQAAIEQQSLAARQQAAQRYYGELVRLNADYLKRYEDSQQRIRSLDDELAQSRRQNERDIADARRAGLSEAQRQAEDFRRLEELRSQFGSAVLRNAGAEARALKEQFDELARGLRTVDGFGTGVARLDAEMQSLFGALIRTEQARERALGDEAAAGVRKTNSELARTQSLVTDLAQQQIAAIKPTVDQAALGELRDTIQAELERRPFRINLAPNVGAGGGTPAPAFATGGPVPGLAPHPRADNVLARVTPGEFIHQVAAVRHYGLDFMRDVNALRYPRFADGGLVSGVQAANDAPLDEVNINLAIGGERVRMRGDRDEARRLARILENVGRGVA